MQNLHIKHLYNLIIFFCRFYLCLLSFCGNCVKYWQNSDFKKCHFNGLRQNGPADSRSKICAFFGRKFSFLSCDWLFFTNLCLPDSLKSIEAVTDVFLFFLFLIIIYINISTAFRAIQLCTRNILYNNFEKNMIEKRCFYSIKQLREVQKVKNYINCICAYYKIKAILSL